MRLFLFVILLAPLGCSLTPSADPEVYALLREPLTLGESFEAARKPEPAPQVGWPREFSSKSPKDAPQGWFSFGFHVVNPLSDTDDFLNTGGSFGGTFGVNLLREKFALGPEMAFIASLQDSDIEPERDDSRYYDNDDVFIGRLMLGARASVYALPGVAPYARGGWMYRWDDGDRDIDYDDSGSGWYAGGGTAIFVYPGMSISPEILYTAANLDVDAAELLVGITFDIYF